MTDRLALRIKYGLPRANLDENFANFQPYGLAFREINKLFRLLLAARPRMGAEQFDKVKVNCSNKKEKAKSRDDSKILS